MESIEIMSNESHSSIASPYLLSTSSTANQHQHRHTNFNLQAVQLSFDACLTFNNVLPCNINNDKCINSASVSSETTSSSHINSSDSIPNAICYTGNNSKSVSCLTLATLPFHQQPCSSEFFEENSNEKKIVYQNDQNNKINSKTYNDKSFEIQKSILDRMNKSKSYQDNLENFEDKDKTDDLNTPVTTSSDVPSFFGPAALVEPPPISGL